jgi:hypothetical protein
VSWGQKNIRCCRGSVSQSMSCGEGVPEYSGTGDRRGHASIHCHFIFPRHPGSKLGLPLGWHLTFIMPFQLSPVETRKRVRKAMPKFRKVACRPRPSQGCVSSHSADKRERERGLC